MSENNPYHGTGLQAMQRSGLTPEENALSRGETMTFEEKAEKLQTGAETITIKYPKLAFAIEAFSQEQGGAQNLSEVDCEHFLSKHPTISYEPAMILAVARKVETTKRTSVLH